MEHDDIPLPTNKYRRSSIFNVSNEENRKAVKVNIPEEKSEIYYSQEYVDKVRTEIEQWEMHISKTLEEKQQFKNKKVELQNAILDERMLSAEQHDFFASLDFDHYLRRVKVFCDRAAIFAHQIEYEPTNEVELRCVATQNKIEKEIFKEDCKQ